MPFLCDHPVVVAPMAGGPTTVDLVRAAGHAGTVGFLAGGYKTVDAVGAELQQVQAAGVPYGLNLFVPRPAPRDVAPLHRYRAELQEDADRYGVELPPLRLHDDDSFDAKVELALDARPPLVSFTFGLPAARIVRAFQQAGCAVLVTVTDREEARAAAGLGVDALVVQGGDAGAHSSTTRPEAYTGRRRAGELLGAVRAVVDLPLLAAGGVGTCDDVAALLAAGATAVQCGTQFLAADEAGTRPVHLAMLLSTDPRETVVTRAFTGQPARALRNRFTDVHSGTAPIGYPAVHHLTAPIRAAAARAGDAESLNLWAGTGYRHVERGAVAEIVDRLTP